MIALIVPLPVRIERLQRNDVGAGRDRITRAISVEAVAGDDARDVRAVAPVVIRLRVAVDEIHEVRDALALAVRNRQVIVPGGDTRIDNRDAYAGAVVPHQLLHGACADGDGGAPDEAVRRTVVMNALDARVADERFQLGRSASSRLTH
jgi:hypothetical protein